MINDWKKGSTHSKEHEKCTNKNSSVIFMCTLHLYKTTIIVYIIDQVLFCNWDRMQIANPV